MSLDGKSAYYSNRNFNGQATPILVNMSFQAKTDGEIQTTNLMLSIISANLRFHFRKPWSQSFTLTQINVH